MRSAFKSVAPVFGAVALVVLGLSSPVSADEHEDSARGTIKIEETEFVDGGDLPNEVKVGCDFSIDFFGMEQGTVPVTFTLMPPSGEGLFAERTAQVQEAQGNELSARLDVDLTQDLSALPPAQSEDFDYKLRVDAEVKTPDAEGNGGITKSAILFVVCEATGDPGAGAPSGEDVAGEEAVKVPVGGVAAGYGGTAHSGTVGGPIAALLGGIALIGLGVAYRRRTVHGA